MAFLAYTQDCLLVFWSLCQEGAAVLLAVSGGSLSEGIDFKASTGHL